MQIRSNASSICYETVDALDLVKSLRVEHPELKVLVLFAYDELSLCLTRASRAHLVISGRKRYDEVAASIAESSHRRIVL